MPSQAMQDAIDALRDRRKASASQAPPPLEQRRAAFTPGDRLHPVPDDVLVSEVTAGGVPAHWLAAPGADTGRVLLFLHGGGYELGSLRSDGELAARLGRASGMRVLFPEYRLAPEHPFPAAIDDVRAAWRWLRTDQDLSATSLAVAGDSAGGGLAVALLVATRDAGQALPAAAALMSPTVDLTSSGASMTERADQDPISTPAMLGQFAAGYLAGADPKTPLASPLFAALAGLPPLLIQVGTADLLLSDSERLATAAAQAGVDVTLEIGEGLPHVYQLLLGTPEAAQATEQIGTFLRASTSELRPPSADAAARHAQREGERVMSIIDEALSANATIANDYDPGRGGPPAPKIAIVTCADPRLTSIEQMLGLAAGDVDMIRNFGTVIDDDAVRSLVLSTRLLGTREIMIINHTDCGMLRFTDSELEDRLRKETGRAPIAPARFYSFTDAEENTKEQIQKARSHPWISPEVPIRGFVYDVSTGRLSEVFPDGETVTS